MSFHHRAAIALAFAGLTFGVACGDAFRTADSGAGGAGATSATAGTGGASTSASASASDASTTGAGGATVGVSSSAGTGGDCGTPSCGACSDPFLAALEDDFEDGTTANVWTPFADSGATVQETLGELRIGTAIGFNPPKNAGYTTSTIAAFHECAVSVRLRSPAGIGDVAGYLTFFQVRSAGANTFVGFAVHDGQLYFEHIDNGTPVDVTSEEYGSDNHAYLRLRDEGGQLHWESSVDGLDWVDRKKIRSPQFLASSRVHLGAGVTQNLQVPSSARFDDVNITP